MGIDACVTGGDLVGLSRDVLVPAGSLSESEPIEQAKVSSRQEVRVAHSSDEAP